MGASRDDFFKYPRTPHLSGGPGTSDDKRLSEAYTAALLGDRGLIVEEKLDGTNVGVHFRDAPHPGNAPGGAELVLQNRGHVLGGGEHPQYGPLKAWCAARRFDLLDALGTRYVLFGEFLHARHTVAYDRLAGLLYEFDLLDKADGTFLPLVERLAICERLGLPTVPVLHRGPATREQLDALIGESRCGATFTDPVTGRTDRRMEGLYLRVEGGDPPRATGRAKLVRPEFVRAIEASDHWRDRPITPNALAPEIRAWR